MSSELPAAIRIDDIASSKVDPDTIYKELDRLKVEVNVLRNDMSLFVQALATIPENQSQQEYYNTLMEKLQTVKAGILEYCVQYNRLVPIINLAQIKLGHDIEGNSKGNASPQKNGKKRVGAAR